MLPARLVRNLPVDGRRLGEVFACYPNTKLSQSSSKILIKGLNFYSSPSNRWNKKRTSHDTVSWIQKNDFIERSNSCSLWDSFTDELCSSGVSSSFTLWRAKKPVYLEPAKSVHIFAEMSNIFCTKKIAGETPSRQPLSVHQYGAGMDQISIKTPNIKSGLYWCLKSLKSGDTVRYVCIFDPSCELAPL